jgi:hypothetical protein
MFDEIRPEGSLLTPPDLLAKQKAEKAAARAEKRAMRIASGEKMPKINPEQTRSTGRPKSIVNRVTEYGSLFNKLNEERISKGLSPLKTAMEVLIDAMQSDELDIKDKARIADKLAPFESSRAPVISIEHVQNIVKEEDVSADDAMDEFLESLRKV